MLKMVLFMLLRLQCRNAIISSTTLRPSSSFSRVNIASMSSTRMQSYVENVGVEPEKKTLTWNTTTPLNERLKDIEEDLNNTLKEIHLLNNDKLFNPNSPKQVAAVLFGKDNDNSSTSKDTLEGMAGAGNKMADLVLKYRKCKSLIKYMNNRKAASSYSVFIEERLDPLYIVDASACIFRAYYSIPPLHRNDGTPVGAVLGVCNMMNRIVLDKCIRGESPRFVLIFDCSKSGVTFRHELFNKYKAQRPPCPVDLVPQFELIQEAAEAYGMPYIEAPQGYEADDVIATLAKIAHKNDLNVNILSGDKDLMQLITPMKANEPTTILIDPFTMKPSDFEVVKEKYGVAPHQLLDVLALAGDSADNVPGVPGIGIKTASKLIQEYNDLENLLENLESLKQSKRKQSILENMSQARLSQQLIELRDVPLQEINITPEHVQNFRIQPLQKNRLLDFFKRMGLRDLHSRTAKKFNMNVPSYSKKKTFKNNIPPSPEQFKDVPF